MPVTRSGSVRPPALTWSIWPIVIPARRASDAPTTHSAASSANQLPSTCHHGSVADTPVRKIPPPVGIFRAWLYQVPISVARPAGLFPGGEVAAERLEAAGGAAAVVSAGRNATGTSRNGANPIMLLRQKIVL